VSEYLTFSATTFSASIDADNVITVQFSQNVETGLGLSLGSSSFAISLSSGDVVLNSFSVAAGGSAATWIITPDVAGQPNALQSQQFSVNLASNVSVQTTTGAGFVMAPASPLMLDMSVPITFSASVLGDNIVKVTFTERVQRVGQPGANAIGADFLVGVSGAQSVSVLAESPNGIEYYLSLDFGTPATGSEAVTINIVGDNALEAYQGQSKVLSLSQAIDAGLLHKEVVATGSALSRNTVRFTFSDAVVPAGGGQALNATHFESSVTTGTGAAFPHVLYVVQDPASSLSFLVSIIPTDFANGNDAFSLNIAPDAIEAISGTPVQPLAQPITGTLKNQTSFQATLLDTNKFQVTFDDDVTEAGGTLSTAAFHLVQLDPAAPTGNEIVPAANLSGIQVFPDTNNAAMYFVQVLT